MIRNLGVAALLLVAPLSSSLGQADPDSVKLRNDCRLAAQVLSKGRPAPHDLWALQIIASCGDLAAEALPPVWQDPPADTVSCAWLVGASVSVRDARVFEASMVAAQTPAGPRLVRLSALRVLATYADPRVSVSLEDLTSRRHLPLLVRDDGNVRDGLQPLPENTREIVMALLQSLAATDPDEEVRGAAAFLSTGLQGRL